MNKKWKLWGFIHREKPSPRETNWLFGNFFKKSLTIKFLVIGTNSSRYHVSLLFWFPMVSWFWRIDSLCKGVCMLIYGWTNMLHRYQKVQTNFVNRAIYYRCICMQFNYCSITIFKQQGPSNPYQNIKEIHSTLV